MSMLFDSISNFQESMTTPLQPIEQLIKSGMVSIKSKLLLLTYTLFLTNQRLVFEINKNSQLYSELSQAAGGAVGGTVGAGGIAGGVAGAAGSLAGSEINKDKIEKNSGYFQIYLNQIVACNNKTFKAFGFIPTGNKGIEFVTQNDKLQVWFGSKREDCASTIQESIKNVKPVQQNAQ